MKKVICVLLTLALLIPNFVSVNAADYSQNEKVTTVTDSKYGFTYTEYVDENNQTIRTYKKQKFSARSSADSSEQGLAGGLSQDATKALLASLGMEDRFINKLSDQELQEYAECEEIYAVSSYTKTDADGKVTNVSKEEAMNAANLRAAVPAPDPGGGSYPSYDTTFSDAYMYLVYVVSYEGNGQYKFSIDSIWLTMPNVRWCDSLGACAPEFTVEPITRNGWRSYTITENVNGTQTVYYIEEELQHGVNNVRFGYAEGYGDWFGSAVMFYLPIDGYTPYNTSIRYSDYCVHYEYIGTVRHSDQTMNFNTTASYCHTVVTLDFTPTLAIEVIAGSVSLAPSIVIAAVLDKDVRMAEFDTSISYVP